MQKTVCENCQMRWIKATIGNNWTFKWHYIEMVHWRMVVVVAMATCLGLQYHISVPARTTLVLFSISMNANISFSSGVQ